MLPYFVDWSEVEPFPTLEDKDLVMLFVRLTEPELQKIRERNREKRRSADVENKNG